MATPLSASSRRRRSVARSSQLASSAVVPTTPCLSRVWGPGRRTALRTTCGELSQPPATAWLRACPELRRAGTQPWHPAFCARERGSPAARMQPTPCLMVFALCVLSPRALQACIHGSVRGPVLRQAEDLLALGAGSALAVQLVACLQAAKADRQSAGKGYAMLMWLDVCLGFQIMDKPHSAVSVCVCIADAETAAAAVLRCLSSLVAAPLLKSTSTGLTDHFPLVSRKSAPTCCQR